jgi:hypothetical protein
MAGTLHLDATLLDEQKEYAALNTGMVSHLTILKTFLLLLGSDLDDRCRDYFSRWEKTYSERITLSNS